MKSAEYKVICGDCLEVMAGMEAASIPTIITDGPYGLGFMGREWDTFKPENVEAMACAERRKRPRTDGRRAMEKAAANAGCYDRSLSANRRFQEWMTVWAEACLRVAKPGAILLAFGGTRTWHRLTCAIEDAGWEIRDCLLWLYGSGFPKGMNIQKAMAQRIVAEHKGVMEEVDARMARIEVAQWAGWNTALKPAWEPIVVAMKPLDGTFAENAERHGVAGFHVDGCRIGISKDIPGGGSAVTSEVVYAGGFPPRRPEIDSGFNPNIGRWPANVVLDEEAAEMLDEQSGFLKGIGLTGEHGGGAGMTGADNPVTYGVGWTPKSRWSSIVDNVGGGASRFFYTGKSSTTERDAGLRGVLPCCSCGAVESRHHVTHHANGQTTVHHLLACGENGIPPLSEIRQNRKVRDYPWRIVHCRRNHHPTVKPLSLMEWLCRLTMTPTGGVVLDPFAGSGTTGVACVNVGRPFIGIEKEAEYVKIAEARIAHAVKARALPLLEAKR